MKKLLLLITYCIGTICSAAGVALLLNAGHYTTDSYYIVFGMVVINLVMGLLACGLYLVLTKLFVRWQLTHSVPSMFITGLVMGVLVLPLFIMGVKVTGSIQHEIWRLVAVYSVFFLVAIVQVLSLLWVGRRRGDNKR